LIPLKDNVPTRHFPIVTLGLIVANVLVFFLYQSPDLEGSVAQLAYQPCEVNDSCPVTGEDWPVTSFTALFMHGSIVHLAGNMLFLWIFGNNVEDAMGRVRYLLFYLLAGYAATAVQTVVTLWTAPESADIPNLGASGAISGVLGAYFVLLPRAKVLTVFFLGVIFFLREIPAVFFLGVYLVFQLVDAGFQFLHPPEGGGVAVFAHLGGMAFGVLAVFLFRKRAPLTPRY
jgi:membrane associated rhomboid family serine protease